MVADHGAVAVPDALSDEVRVRQGAVLPDDGGGADRDSMGMIDNHARPDGGSGGNLRAGERRAKVACQQSERAQVMKMQPSGGSVQQHRVEAGVEQDHAELGEEGRLPPRKLTDIRTYVFVHPTLPCTTVPRSISFARSVPMPGGIHLTEGLHFHI